MNWAAGWGFLSRQDESGRWENSERVASLSKGGTRLKDARVGWVEEAAANGGAACESVAGNRDDGHLCVQRE